MYCLIFQSKDLFKLFVKFNESLPIFAYKCYAYKEKKCIWMPGIQNTRSYQWIEPGSGKA